MRSVISAVFAMALVGCLASGADAKTIVYCSDAAPEGFDPALYVTEATLDASSQALYNRLVEFAPRSGSIQLALAESFEVSKDGRTYTFHLRQGVKFHTTPYFTPKRDLNADDVVFSLTRQVDKKNPYYAYAGGMWPYYQSLGLDTVIKSVTKVDTATVKIVLTRADGGFLADLAMDFASILSKEYADSLLKPDRRRELDEKPIGTGPYQLFYYAPGKRIIYDANDSYWRGAQKIDLLAFLITPSAATRFARLKDGTCEVMASANAETVKAAKADSNLAVAEAERLDLAFLAFNTTQKPFDDPRVRRALGAAIDKQAIVDAVYGGAAVVANSIMPHSMWGYDGQIIGEFRSVDYARSLLAEAGVSGLKLNLLTTTAGRPYNPNLATTAAMIAADLAKVGVEATVETPQTLDEYFRKSIAKDRDGGVLIGWTSDNGDPGDFLSLLLSCDAVGASNRAEWCNDVFSRLIADANAAPDPAVRRALYSEAQRMLSAESPITPIAHTLFSVPMSRGVTGFNADPLGHHNFEGVDVAK